MPTFQIIVESIKQIGLLETSNILFIFIFLGLISLAWRYITTNITNKLNDIIEYNLKHNKDESDREARLTEKFNVQNEKITVLLTGINVIVSKTLLGDEDETK
jgi:hypothetical protein